MHQDYDSYGSSDPDTAWLPSLYDNNRRRQLGSNLASSPLPLPAKLGRESPSSTRPPSVYGAEAPLHMRSLALHLPFTPLGGEPDSRSTFGLGGESMQRAPPLSTPPTSISNFHFDPWPIGPLQYPAPPLPPPASSLGHGGVCHAPYDVWGRARAQSDRERRRPQLDDFKSIPALHDRPQRYLNKPVASFPTPGESRLLPSPESVSSGLPSLNGSLDSSFSPPSTLTPPGLPGLPSDFPRPSSRGILFPTSPRSPLESFPPPLFQPQPPSPSLDVRPSERTRSCSTGSPGSLVASKVPAFLRRATSPPFLEARGDTLPSGLPLSPNRSPWTMWVGNVPSDATYDELWACFNSRPLVQGIRYGVEPTAGIESIHLIARSNCAFVNFISQDHLMSSIEAFSGASLRVDDRRCKPFLCRQRMHSDDALSGVGAQRTGGVHKAYVRVHLNPVKTMADNDQDDELSDTSSSSELYREWFPRRFFILKALDRKDLDNSVQTSVWRTQGHNQQVLDQAFRTSSEAVILFFSANKSGEFYGYAKMTGPISPHGSANSSKSPSPSNSSCSSLIAGSEPSDSLGLPFPVEWIRVHRVPFTNTRHVHNKFNSGREVKISRDGTEVDPQSAELLLNEFWETPTPRATKIPSSQ